jgi:biotin operon repressor
MSHLNLNQKIQLLKRFNSEKRHCSKTLVARELGCHRTTIYRQINKLWPESGEEVVLKEKNTRKKKNSYTVQEEEKVLSFFDNYPFASYKDCRLLEKLRFTIPTIRNLLMRNGVKTYVSKSKPFLNLGHQVKR